MGEIYYTVPPIFKEVTQEQLREFINAYPRQLEAIPYSPSETMHNDFELAPIPPDSIVAKEEDGRYFVAENYEEMFSSRTPEDIEIVKRDAEENEQNRERLNFVPGNIRIFFKNSNNEVVGEWEDRK